MTRLLITLRLESQQSIRDAVEGLPEYCASTFQEVERGVWCGEFVISCPVAPELADGDFVDDFSPYFPALIRLKGLHDAEFLLDIAVGAPAPEMIELRSFSVALVAALGASIRIRDNATSKR